VEFDRARLLLRDNRHFHRLESLAFLRAIASSSGLRAPLLPTATLRWP